jgi:hypothetical protein
METFSDEITSTEIAADEFLTGLAYDTQYFVFYSDPFLAGGAVTYLESTTKTDALSSPNYFFVGSIRTPKAGAIDTSGNGDGGTGAQSGMVNTLSPSTTVTSLLGTGYSISSPTNAFDGDTTTFATLTQNGGGVSAQDFTLPPGITRRYSSIQLVVVWSCPTNTLAGGLGNALSLGAMLGPNGPTPFATLAEGVTQGLTISTFTYGPNTNPSQCSLRAILNGSTATGTVVVQVNEVYLLCIE